MISGDLANKKPASIACDEETLRDTLKSAGLRPTRQRISLAQLLFSKGERHITAEDLHDEALGEKLTISLATIYNTLHQFTEVGLLREVAIEGARTYFDTNTGDHHHYFIEGEGEIIDVPDHKIAVDGLPKPPEGLEISRVDVVIRLRRKSGA